MVSANGERSHSSAVLSGVPQGTVLGPILFLIMMIDIDDSIKYSSVSSFADDTRLRKGVKSVPNCDDLQSDINAISVWAEANKMKFNETKFEAIQYVYNLNNPVNPEHTYLTCDNSSIERKNIVKDLGVQLSNDMNFSHHIETITRKARQMCGWVLRTFESREAKPLMVLFKSLVRSGLEYNCPLWNPSSATCINKIEAVQRTFTSKIKQCENMNYWERLKYLRITSLERRRDRYDIVYMWKMLEGLVPTIPTLCVRENIRLGRYVVIPSIPTKIREKWRSVKFQSFCCRAGRSFNSMPKELRNLTGVKLETFKQSLDKLLRWIPDKPRVPGYSSFVETNQIRRIAAHQEALDEEVLAM